MTSFSKRQTPQMMAEADREKSKAAGSSVFAACGLVGLKLVVGFTTGSLGILAEALHSGLDLVAAVITWFAVRVSSKPADRVHPYGHGKYENLSALFETLLLLVTCFWIIYAAMERLLTHKVEIEVNVWSYAVMIISIIVDVSRSRMLYRVAHKHNSQALEADALHFSTDIWSSAVVILGLLCVGLGDLFKGPDFLHYADAIAAIVVGLIVIQVSWKLGARTINVLLDAAPAGLEKKVIAATEGVPGVLNCHFVRIRASGAHVFIDLHVLMDGNKTLNEAHRLTEDIERAVEAVSPGADVVIHPEPK
ncbi:MAG: cation transporter [Candidatus Omnitrophica bacterium]|nr:cation transporter [Candidatus Omnitrophota bacterium]